MKSISWKFEIPKTFLEDSSGHESPNKTFEAREKDFRAIRINWFSLQKNENNFHKILENSGKTLKMDELILKDTHNPKLNILECDRTTPLKQNLVPRFASAGDKKKR